MYTDPPESDWKYLRRLKPELLDRICRRINAGTSALLEVQGKSEYERYLLIFEHIQKSDEIIAECFDDWRRSRFYERMWAIIAHELMTPEEYAGLSEEVRESLDHAWNRT